MSGKTRWLVPLVMTLIAAFGGAVFTNSAPSDSVETFGFTIRFVGVEYDVDLDESKWTYIVEGGPNALQVLDYWELALCAPEAVVVRPDFRLKTSHPDETSVGHNPETSINGIKFDVGINPDGVQEFWFVLKGNWEIGEVEIAAKVDGAAEVRTIHGPTCDLVLCYVQYIVEHGRKDFRVLQPGIYASLLNVIHLSGTGAAQITFEDFGRAEPVADPGAAPVELRFFIGDTPAAADAPEWLTAAELNNSVLNVDAAALEGGVSYSIWIRLHVDERHRSIEYEVIGKVSISVECV